MMLSPAAMHIEAAVDSLKNVPDWLRGSQLKELISALGFTTAQKIGLPFPLTEETKKAYELGLQTARIVLSGSSALALHHIDAKDIL